MSTSRDDAQAPAWPLLGVAIAALLVACVALYDWQRAGLTLLKFGTLHFIVVLACAPLLALVPAKRREHVLVLLSLAFVTQALSAELAVALVVNLGVIFACTRLPRLARTAVFVGWTGLFYGLVPARLHMWDLADALPIIVSVILYTTFRRSLFLLWEMHTGAVREVPVTSLAAYMLGVQFLGPRGIEPSFRHFVTSQASTPEALRQTVASGLKVTAYCLAALVGAIGIIRTFHVNSPKVSAESGTELVVFAWLWFMEYYLLRVATEQGAVGLSRLLGYQIRDNFHPKVLLASRPAEFWRGWNALWQEFLIGAFYYPVTLSLGRRLKSHGPLVIALAGMATFLGTALVESFPIVFLISYLRPPPPTSTQLAHELVSQSLWGLVVAVDLFVTASRPRRKRDSQGAWLLKVLATHVVVVVLMVYKRNPVLFAALAKMQAVLGGS